MDRIVDGRVSATIPSIFLLLVLVAAALAIVPAQAAPKTVWYVDDDGGYDFTTIQEAIDASTTGDKIFVYAGTYMENLIIDVSITLTGEDPATTIIDGSGGGDCIYVDADDVKIIGFTIRDGEDDGIYIRPSEGCVITGNTIHGNYEDGILLINADDCTITGNTIEDNDEYGIYLAESDDNEIIGNIITGNDDENIRMQGSDTAPASGNLIKGNEISYSDTDEGIFMLHCEESEVIGNEIKYNDDYGIWLSECDSNTVSGNEITDNGLEGIRMRYSYENEISRNTVLRNGGYGISLEEEDDDNTIENNTALDNTTYDLYQGSGCDNNEWLRNTYEYSYGIP